METNRLVSLTLDLNGLTALLVNKNDAGQKMKGNIKSWCSALVGEVLVIMEVHFYILKESS